MTEQRPDAPQAEDAAARSKISDVVPLFATLKSSTLAFADSLAAMPMTAGTSPWSPKLETPTGVDEAALLAEVEKTKQAAIDQGRAQGLAETDAMRTRLKKLITELEHTREARAERFAEAIADAAIAAIEAWVGSYDRAALFQPIIRGWIASAGEATAATARVNPADTAAMKTAIGDAPIKIEADPKVAPGDLQLSGDSLDTTHVWRDRLRELREAIATAIESESK
jgi:flagellar biosynthesis/type III secretory pathway protein FliH